MLGLFEKKETEAELTEKREGLQSEIDSLQKQHDKLRDGEVGGIESLHPGSGSTESARARSTTLDREITGLKRQLKKLKKLEGGGIKRKRSKKRRKKTKKKTKRKNKKTTKRRKRTKKR